MVVWKDRDPEVSEVLALVERKGMPVHVVGGPEKKPKARRKRQQEVPNSRGLPD